MHRENRQKSRQGEFRVYKSWLPEYFPFFSIRFLKYPPKVNILFHEISEKVGPEGLQPKINELLQKKNPQALLKSQQILQQHQAITV